MGTGQISMPSAGGRTVCCPRALTRLLPSAVRVRIRSRSTSARPPRTAIMRRPVLVAVSAHGSASERNCAPASTMRLTAALLRSVNLCASFDPKLFNLGIECLAGRADRSVAGWPLIRMPLLPDCHAPRYFAPGDTNVFGRPTWASRSWRSRSRFIEFAGFSRQTCARIFLNVRKVFLRDRTVFLVGVSKHGIADARQ